MRYSSRQGRRRGRTDSDTLKLACVPHGRPSHAHGYANHRATSRETTLNSTNAAALTLNGKTFLGIGLWQDGGLLAFGLP